MLHIYICRCWRCKCEKLKAIVINELIVQLLQQPTKTWKIHHWLYEMRRYSLQLLTKRMMGTQTHVCSQKRWAEAKDWILQWFCIHFDVLTERPSEFHFYLPNENITADSFIFCTKAMHSPSDSIANPLPVTTYMMFILHQTFVWAIWAEITEYSEHFWKNEIVWILVFETRTTTTTTKTTTTTTNPPFTHIPMHIPGAQCVY